MIKFLVQQIMYILIKITLLIIRLYNKHEFILKYKIRIKISMMMDIKYLVELQDFQIKINK